MQFHRAPCGAGGSHPNPQGARSDESGWDLHVVFQFMDYQVISLGQVGAQLMPLGLHGFLNGWVKS